MLQKENPSIANIVFRHEGKFNDKVFYTENKLQIVFK